MNNFEQNVKQLLINLNIYDEKVNLQTFYAALTHTTYSNEHKSVKDFQYLEFLGDSIIQFFVTTEIYKNFPNYKEGIATKHRSYVVNNKTLSTIANKLHIPNYVRASKNAFINGKNDKVNSDFFEAFTGAIYIEKGLDFVSKFLKDNLNSYIHNVTHDDLIDAKSEFQEVIQMHGISKIIYKSEPINEKEFSSSVIVDGQIFGTGIGKNKRSAEQEAAKNALKNLISNK